MRCAGLASLAAGPAILLPTISTSVQPMGTKVGLLLAGLLVVTGIAQLMGALRSWRSRPSAPLLSGAALTIVAGAALAGRITDGPEVLASILAFSFLGIALARMALVASISPVRGRALAATSAVTALAASLLMLSGTIANRDWSPWSWWGFGVLLVVSFTAHGLWLMIRSPSYFRRSIIVPAVREQSPHRLFLPRLKA